MDPKFTPNFQVPDEMRDFAEKSVEQARKAFDGFLGAAQKAVDSVDGSTSVVHSSTQDMARRSLGYTEQNMRAAFDHAQKLVRARDVQEAMQLQTDFIRNQFTAMQDQMKDLSSGVQKAATETAGAAKRKG